MPPVLQVERRSLGWKQGPGGCSVPPGCATPQYHRFHLPQHASHEQVQHTVVCLKSFNGDQVEGRQHRHALERVPHRSLSSLCRQPRALPQEALWAEVAHRWDTELSVKRHLMVLQNQCPPPQGLRMGAWRDRRCKQPAATSTAVPWLWLLNCAMLRHRRLFFKGCQAPPGMQHATRSPWHREGRADGSLQETYSPPSSQN